MVRQGKRRVENANAFAIFELLALCRRKEFDRALAAQEATQRGAVIEDRLRRAILLTTLGKTAEAERLLLDDLKDQARATSDGLIFGYLYLLGPTAGTDPRREADDFLKRSPELVADWRDGWYRNVLRYNAGRMTADDLVAKAGASRYNQCEGYFYIGLHKLYERKRAEAKACFAKSVEAGVWPFGEYQWSAVFLSCIDDPNWLPWAVEKK